MFEKFIEENLEKDIKNFETNTDLYERYRRYCRFHEVKAITKIQFCNQMRNYNVGAKYVRKRNYISETGRWGVKLLPCKY